MNREPCEVTGRQVRSQYREGDGADCRALALDVVNVKAIVAELADVEVGEQIVERDPADRLERSAAQTESNIAAGGFQQVAGIHGDRYLHSAGYVRYVNKTDGTGDADVTTRQVEAGITRGT